jgi:hypothetical protein
VSRAAANLKEAEGKALAADPAGCTQAGIQQRLRLVGLSPTISGETMALRLLIVDGTLDAWSAVSVQNYVHTINFSYLLGEHHEDVNYQGPEREGHFGKTGTRVCAVAIA